MKIHIVEAGQSLFDVAIITYGDVTGIKNLLKDNAALNGPTDRIYPGQQLLYREEAIDLRKKAYLEDYKVIATIKNEDMPEGIGFWRLDEYLVGGVPADLAFVPDSIVYSVNPPESGGGFVITLAINLEGVYTVTFTDEATNEVQTFPNTYLQTNTPYGFGVFFPGTFTITIGPISSQITIPA